MTQYSYRIGDEVYDIPNEKEKEAFLSLYPDAELITPQINLEPAEEERTYPYYVKDENSDIGISAYDVPASKLRDFETLNPEAINHVPKYTYDINPDSFYSESFVKDMDLTLGQRFAGRYIQQALPFPVEDTIPPPETLGEKITDFAGGGLGMMAGFGLFKLGVGGVKTGLKAGSKYANKILTRYSKLKEAGKNSQAQKLLDKEIKKGTFVTEAGESLGPVSSGLLGHSKTYAQMISNVASQYPKTAIALDEFISNGLAFGAHGQFKSHLPIWDITERSKQFINDAIVGSMFTIAGSPQFLETSKMVQHTVTPTLLFAVGAGSDFGMPFSPGGETPEMTLVDRLTHGFGMVSLYYGHKGLNSFQIRKQQKQALRGLGMPEAEVNKFMKENRNIADEAVKMTVKTRDPDFREEFIGKAGSFKDKRVDVLRIDSTSGRVPRVTYQDLDSNAIQNMPLKQFTRRYERATNIGEQDVFSVESQHNKKKRQWTVEQKDIRGNRIGSVEKFKSKTDAGDRVGEIDSNIKDNLESHRQAQIAAKTKESALQLSPKDAKYMKEALYPESEGSTVSMGVKELLDYNKILNYSVRASTMERPNLAYLETARDRKGILGAFDSINRSLIIDPVTYLRKIGEKSPAAKELSYKLEAFRDIYDLETGAYTTLQLRLESLGLKKNQIDNLFGEIDPFFKDYVTAEAIDPKVKGEAIGLIKQTLSNTVDKAVAYGLSVKIVDKGGRSRVEPIWAAFDAKGKLIDIDVATTTKALSSEVGKGQRQESGIQSLKVGDSVKTLEGKTKEIAEIKFNHIQKDYMHRIITKEARDLFGTNQAYQSYVIQKMSKFDADARGMRERRIELETKARNAKSKAKKRQYEEEALQYSEAEIDLAMNEKFSKVSGYIDDIGIYGNQYSRVKSEIPPEIALDAGGKVIELDKYNTYKKGDVVENRTIDRIVKIYETNLSDVMSRYANKMAHVLSVTGTYGSDSLTPEGKVKGSPGVRGVIAQEIINSITRETNSQSISKYVETLIKNQIHGTSIEQEAADLTVRSFNSIIGAVSNAALSAPTAGLKNLMLGQGANATIFGIRATGKAFAEMSTKKGYRDLLEQAASVGAIEAGTRLLETQKLLRYNPGGMYITELVNRMVAVAAGRISAKSALDVMLGKKSPLSERMSRAQAEHLLFKTFDLQNMNQIIKRGHFTAGELEKIMQRAHRVTQGQPTIEYMPTAFQSKAARPFTLFHRMAYRSTNTMYKNAIVPAGNGNIWPLVKFAGAAYATGAAKEYLYYLASGAPERDMFQTTPVQIFNTALQGEILGVFSNLFDDRGPAYAPAVLEYSKKTGSLVAYWLAAAGTGIGGDVAKMYNMLDKLEGEPGKPLSPEDKERIKQETFKTITEGLMDESVDYLTNTISGFNMIKKGWAQRAKAQRTEAEYVSKLQNIYAEAKGVKDMRTDVDRVYNAKTEFYSQLKDLFWAGTQPEQRRIYEAAVMLVTNNNLNDNPGVETIESALKRAVQTVDKKITSTSPTYSLSKDAFRAGVPLHRSQYQTFLKFLQETSPDDVARVVATQKDWEIRKAMWDDTVKDVKYNLEKYGYNIDYRKHYGAEPPMNTRSMYEDPSASRAAFQ